MVYTCIIDGLQMYDRWCTHALHIDGLQMYYRWSIHVLQMVHTSITDGLHVYYM